MFDKFCDSLENPVIGIFFAFAMGGLLSWGIILACGAN